MMEDLGESSGGTTGSLAADGVAVGVRLQRLGDYRILREIGRGGMGVVYEAEQESLGRRVALKVLSAGSLLDPKQVRRFEREAKAAARLHHTNIVPVFGVGRQDGHHYFVMQFIAGVGLDVVLDDLRRLRQAKSEAGPAAGLVAASSRIAGLSAADVARSLLTGRFEADADLVDGSMTEPFDDAAPGPTTAVNGPPTDSSPAILPGSSELSASSDPDRQFYRSIARIGVQVAEALEYANRQGILHRDVKPSNLLLDNHGNVWVADFGLAKTAEADDLTHTGDILGTIRYMAPERFSGHCDARRDVYSLGLTLYELVALRPAYEATDRHRLMDRVLHEEPERLEEAGSERAAGPGDDRRQGDGARPGGAVRDGSRAGGGPAAVRRGPADPGAADLAGGAAGAVVPAEQGAGGGDRPGGGGAGGRGRLVAAYAEQQPGTRGCPEARRRRTSPRADDRLRRRRAQGRPVRVEPPAGDARPGARPGRLREGAGRRRDALDFRVAADGDHGGRRGRPACGPGQPVGLAPPPRRAEGCFPPGDVVGSVAFSPDGKIFVTGCRWQHGAALGRRHRPAHRQALAAAGAVRR